MKLNNYTISQKFINKDFLEDVKKLNFKELLAKEYYISDKYFYTYIDIVDFENKKLGIALSAQPIEKVQITIDQTSYIIWIALTILIIDIVISMILS